MNIPFMVIKKEAITLFFIAFSPFLFSSLNFYLVKTQVYTKWRN